jgi:mannosyltransferase OCH1-like enzyme
MNTIPKKLFRVWLGSNPIPELFNEWWDGFRRMHRGWSLITINDSNVGEFIPSNEIRDIIQASDSYATQSNIVRVLAIAEGGIYIDCDFKPLKPLDILTGLTKPFACLRSSRSFENAVLGSPPRHREVIRVIKNYPAFFWSLSNRTAVTTGPQYVSKMWFGNKNVAHLPIKMFYPYNGFMAPKRDEKLKIFNSGRFPTGMLAAHFSNHRWGGTPNKAVDAHT